MLMLVIGIFLYMLYIVYKKPFYGITIYLIIVSTAPIWELFLNDIIIYSFYTLIVFLLIFKLYMKKIKISIYIYYILFMSIYNIMIMVLINSSINSFILAEYQFILIPLITILSLKNVRIYQVNLTKLILPYLSICLIIFYYRAFIDYSFFGLVDLYNFDSWSNLYTFGGSNYRPSNLNSPIIFSIELVVYLAIILYEQGFKKITKYLFLLSIVPLILMRSRSSIVILIFTLIVILLKKKNVKYFFPVGIGCVIICSLFGNYIGLEEIFKFANSSYVGRFNSALTSIESFFDLDLIKILFGNGVGSANYNGINSNGFLFYTENYFVAKLIDTGLIGLMIFLVIIILCLLKTKNVQLKTIFFGLLLVNLIASSMSGYVIKVLFWIIVYLLWYSNKKDEINYE